MSEYNNNSKKYSSQYPEDDQLMINLIDQGLSETGRTFIHCTFTSQPEYIDGGWLNIFPKLPADWQTFTLIEESERENPLVKFDIKRNKFGVFQVVMN